MSTSTRKHIGFPTIDDLNRAYAPTRKAGRMTWSEKEEAAVERAADRLLEVADDHDIDVSGYGNGIDDIAHIAKTVQWFLRGRALDDLAYEADERLLAEISQIASGIDNAIETMEASL